MAQIYTGPHAGQWLAVSRFPDWETFGKAQPALASDTTFQQLMSESLGLAQLADRAVVVDIDL
jgi:hypothetical protein